LYGLTTLGGAHGDGVLFSIDTNGNSYTDLWDFNGTDGAVPYGTLIPSGKVLYGMTSAGGANGDGVVFRIENIDLGVNNLTAAPGDVKVYPNPSNGIFTVETGNSHPSGTNNIKIYNVLGEQVFQEYSNEKTTNISVADLSSGVYFLKVLTPEGTTLMQKICITR
jgi:uncharacterized repeat protein (TIGR03803 family)